MSEKLVKIFNNLNLNNKIGHAYLIANTNLESVCEELKEVLYKFIFNNTDYIKLNENKDVFILEPENQIIKKNQIQELKLFLNNTSQISGKKVYIIDHAELLNASSANSLLKTLEEPENNIYAFLITSNIEKTLKTIKSRCQIIFLSSEENKDLKYSDNDFYEEALNIIKIIEINKEKCFPYVYQLIVKKNDKKYMNELLENFIKIYEQCLKYKISGLNINSDSTMIEEISSLVSNSEIMKKLIIINKFLADLNYNLNNSLFIDKLLIELGGKK